MYLISLFILISADSSKIPFVEVHFVEYHKNKIIIRSNVARLVLGLLEKDEENVPLSSLNLFFSSRRRGARLTENKNEIKRNIIICKRQKLRVYCLNQLRLHMHLPSSASEHRGSSLNVFFDFGIAPFGILTKSRLHVDCGKHQFILWEKNHRRLCPSERASSVHCSKLTHTQSASQSDEMKNIFNCNCDCNWRCIVGWLMISS